MAPVVYAFGPGEPDPSDPAEVRIMWQDGGTMLLPITTWEQAQRDALTWSLAIHRDGRDGVIMVSCLR